VPKCHFCPEWSGREKEKDPSCPKGTPIPIASGIKKGLKKERERSPLLLSFHLIQSCSVNPQGKERQKERGNGKYKRD
jgi:hypothetical protein